MYKISKKEKKNKFFCVAIGSRDRALSVWLIDRKRPLFVMHDLFDDSILDLSWSQDGYKLLTCSWDGTVAFFEFTEKEIGKVLDSEEVASYLHKIYGKNMTMNQKAITNSTMFIEDVEMLKVREKNEVNKKIIQNGSVSCSRSNHLNENTNSNTSRLSKGSIDKQIETRTSDGKRRIIPLYIPPSLNHDGMPVPFNAEKQILFSTSSQVKSTIQIEKVDSLQSAASLLSQPSPDKKSETEQAQQFKDQKSKEITNNYSILNNGINNISNNKQPTVNNKETSNDQSKKQSHQSKSKDKSISKSSLNCSTTQINDKQDKNKLLNGTTTNKKIDLTTIIAAPVKQVPTLSQQSVPQQQNDKRVNDKQVKLDHKLNSFVNLYSPKIDKAFSINLNTPEEFKNHSLVIDNNLNNSDLCSVRLLDQEQNRLWQVLISQKVSTVVNSDEIVCVCCEDDTMHIFNLQTGSRLSTPFILSSSVSKLACFKYKVLVITIKAELWLWDLKMRKVIVKNVSLIPLINNNSNQTEISITNYCITSSGLPLITLSTGKTYVYDLNFEGWHLLSSNQDLLNYSCDYKQKITNNVVDYPLSLIQSQQRYVEFK